MKIELKINIKVRVSKYEHASINDQHTIIAKRLTTVNYQITATILMLSRAVIISTTDKNLLKKSDVKFLSIFLLFIILE